MQDRVSAWKRWTFWATGFLILLMAFFLLRGGSRKDILSPKPRAIAEGGVIVGRAKGKKQWELKVSSVTWDEKRDIIRLDGISYGTFFRDDKPVIRFRAGKGIAHIAKRDLRLSGGVELTSEEGVVIRMRELLWDSEMSRITGAGPIEIDLTSP